jgi:CheY-like chemotaxis protein
MPTILIADAGGLFIALETSPVLRIGCRLVPIRSAKEMPTQAATEAPDLILLDADHLGSGLRAGVRALKEDRRLDHVPIVIAANDGESCRRMLSAKDVVLQKPIAPEDVVATLKRLLPLPRRASPRVPLAVPVHCKIGRRNVTLRLKDLASGGIFVRTPDSLSCGTRFEATFPLPDPEAGEGATRTISATCEVVRRVTSEEEDLIAGVGASFVQIANVDASLVERFVASARG